MMSLPLILLFLLLSDYQFYHVSKLSQCTVVVLLRSNFISYSRSSSFYVALTHFTSILTTINNFLAHIVAVHCALNVSLCNIILRVMRRFKTNKTCTKINIDIYYHYTNIRITSKEGGCLKRLQEQQKLKPDGKVQKKKRII